MNKVLAIGGAILAAIVALYVVVFVDTAIITMLAQSGWNASSGLTITIAAVDFILKIGVPIWLGIKTYKYLRGKGEMSSSQ